MERWVLHLLHASGPATFPRCKLVSESKKINFPKFNLLANSCLYFTFRMNVLNQTIKNGEFDTSHPNYQALSALAKNLIEGLINTDPE